MSTEERNKIPGAKYGARCGQNLSAAACCSLCSAGAAGAAEAHPGEGVVNQQHHEAVGYIYFSLDLFMGLTG